jgi:hypothetical protein
MVMQFKGQKAQRKPDLPGVNEALPNKGCLQWYCRVDCQITLKICGVSTVWCGGE